MEMDKFTPEYSLKNMPFPGEHEFILSLTDKIGEFIKKMQWKIHFYLNPSDSQKEQRPGGRKLKSQRTPTSNRKLDQFEDDLFGLIRKIKFSNLDSRREWEETSNELGNPRKFGSELIILRTYTRLTHVNMSKSLIIRSRNNIK